MFDGLLHRAAVHAALADENRLAIVDALTLTDLTPAALAGSLGMPTNLVAHHLLTLERAGLIERRRSDGDRRRRYVSLRSERLPGGPLMPVVGGQTILFACRRNSARSQLAAALFRHLAGRTAYSAGAEPAEHVHPKAVRVAEENGLELDSTTRGYGDVPVPDIVVTVCDIAREEPLPPPSSMLLHWSIPDPVADGRTAAFRSVLRQLEGRVDTLSKALT